MDRLFLDKEQYVRYERRLRSNKKIRAGQMSPAGLAERSDRDRRSSVLHRGRVLCRHSNWRYKSELQIRSSLASRQGVQGFRVQKLKRLVCLFA